jgi:cytochrome c oxidase subunit 6c
MSQAKAQPNAGCPKLNKPIMRGLHLAQTKRNLAVTFVLIATTVTSVYFLRNKPRKQAYADFYRTYDAEKNFNRMRDAGLLQSCPKM